MVLPLVVARVAAAAGGRLSARGAARFFSQRSGRAITDAMFNDLTRLFGVPTAGALAGWLAYELLKRLIAAYYAQSGTVPLLAGMHYDNDPAWSMICGSRVGEMWAGSVGACGGTVAAQIPDMGRVNRTSIGSGFYVESAKWIQNKRRVNATTWFGETVGSATRTIGPLTWTPALGAAYALDAQYLPAREHDPAQTELVEVPPMFDANVVLPEVGTMFPPLAIPRWAVPYRLVIPYAGAIPWPQAGSVAPPIAIPGAILWPPTRARQPAIDRPAPPVTIPDVQDPDIAIPDVDAPAIPRNPARARSGPGELLIRARGRSVTQARRASTHVQRVPPQGVKETKVRPPRWLREAIGAFTESLDFLGALYWAIPSWKRRELLAEARRMGLTNAQAMLRALWEGWDTIDFGQALQNMVVNEIGDRAVAASGRAQAKLRTRISRQWSTGFDNRAPVAVHRFGAVAFGRRGHLRTYSYKVGRA